MDPSSPATGHARTPIRKSRLLRRRSSLEVPDKFKDAADATSDVTAPRTARGRLMNQSFISLIANVGSSASFNPRFSLLERDGHTTTTGNLGVEHVPPQQLPQTTNPRPASLRKHAIQKRMQRHTPQMAGSVPNISRDSDYADDSQDIMTMSQILPPMSERPMYPGSSGKLSPDVAEDIAPNDETEPVDEPTEAADTTVEDDKPAIITAEDLSNRLADIFGFKEPESILSEYPCWFLQSVLLQGYMYITALHVCFFAFLPKRQSKVAKSGSLFKRGRQNPKYNKYWFVLKGDILSYFTNPKELYFPRNAIDLRSVSSAQVILTASGEETTAFTLTTSDGPVYFKADSVTSAVEWVKQLQKAIFRLRNDGDSVKICIPLDNILDIENNPLMNFADTFRIRVIDNDETYAIDENGDDALQVLRNAVDERNSALNVAKNTNEGVHRSQQQQQRVPDFVDTTTDDQNSEESDHDQNTDSTSLAASQILGGSDVFQRPTIRPTRGHRQSAMHPARRKKVVAPAPRLELRDHLDPSHNVAGRDAGIDSDYNEPPSLHEVARPTSSSSTTVQDIMRAGTYPLQKASELAVILRSHSRKVGTMLTSGSLGYYEKVSTMWAGKREHYGDSEDIVPHDYIEDPAEEGHGERVEGDFGDRFRAHFKLPSSERLRATYYGYLHRVVPVYGKIYVGETKLCFRNLLPGTRTMMILPIRDIENVDKEKGFRFGYSGLVLAVQGHEELFFEFSKADARDDCAITLLQSLDAAKDLSETQLLTEDEKRSIKQAEADNKYLEQARRNSLRDRTLDPDSNPLTPDTEHPPILFDDPMASIIDFKPPESLNIVCLTIGSRGDVQPYIALCKGLMADGHRTTIATHEEFGPWIKHHGIEFRPVAGDPAEIMRLCVENDMFTVNFFKEALSKFRGWVDDLLVSSWVACEGADLLIESPSAMGGIHIAEALQIPYFRAFTMPWTRTRAYPHAFAVPAQKMGGNYNSFSYVMFDHVFWAPIAGQINRWRVNTLNIPATTLDRMDAGKVPFLYNFSPSVVVPPLDFNQWIHITGYWFLDEGASGQYQPPAELLSFIAEARRDGKKLVYVGFGSMVVEDPMALTKTIVDAVLKADVRCILSKGWSDRLGNPSAASKPEIPLPPQIFQIKSAPHDWLFARVDAAAHHGGAGTTGASLRAGIPTICKPFFGDQFFYSQRVEDLGVGRCLKIINTSVFARALWEVTSDARMIAKARRLGEKIRAEDGVQTAIQAIYRELEYAKSLIKRKKSTSSTSLAAHSEAEGTGNTSPSSSPASSGAAPPPPGRPDDSGNSKARSVAARIMAGAGLRRSNRSPLSTAVSGSPSDHASEEWTFVDDGAGKKSEAAREA